MIHVLHYNFHLSFDEAINTFTAIEIEAEVLSKALKLSQNIRGPIVGKTKFSFRQRGAEVLKCEIICRITHPEKRMLNLKFSFLYI